MTKILRYAGIGPRKSTAAAQSVMSYVGHELGNSGWLLRSGRAVGADQAFEDGCDQARGTKEIFLPWNNFNHTTHSPAQGTYYIPPTPEQLNIACQYHPAWHKCSDGAKLLLARNVLILLGRKLDEPVDCVITNLPPGYQGGTKHALSIASGYGIPVFNLAHKEDMEALSEFTQRVEDKAYA